MHFVFNGLGIPTWLFITRDDESFWEKNLVTLVLRRGNNQIFKEHLAMLDYVTVYWADEGYFSTLTKVINGLVGPVTYINVVSKIDDMIDIMDFERTFIALKTQYAGNPENLTVINISSGAVTNMEAAGKTMPITTYPGYKKHMEDFIQSCFDYVWNIRAGFFPDIIQIGGVVMKTLSKATLKKVILFDLYENDDKGFAGTPGINLVNLITYLSIPDTQYATDGTPIHFMTKGRDGIRSRMHQVVRGNEQPSGPVEDYHAAALYERALACSIFAPFMPTTEQFDAALLASAAALQKN